MKIRAVIILLSVSLTGLCQGVVMPQSMQFRPATDSAKASTLHTAAGVKKVDTAITVLFPDVNIISFKTNEEWLEYYRSKAHLLKVLPYVKIAKQIYLELKEKEDSSSRKQYRHYKKETEKDMREKFEKELKDLTNSDGKMLFKLINRETGNNCYNTIKELKGPFMAWFYQSIAKRYGYDLKENYDPKKEKIIELIIKELGPAYKV